MPKKCESCFYYIPHPDRPDDFEAGHCFERNMRKAGPSSNVMSAREICDIEGDGVFAYYEPRKNARAERRVAAVCR